MERTREMTSESAEADEMAAEVDSLAKDAEDLAARGSEKRANPLRRLYQWVIGWADTPYGTPALATISFAESSFFPIPPDVLQVALSFAKPKRSYYYALVSAGASVLGGMLGWLIGYAFWSSTSGFFFGYVPGFSQENFDLAGSWYKSNAFLSIVAAAFTPIPYKVVTIAAGVFSDFVPLKTLVFASAIGRTGRFTLVATAIYFFGEPARKILEKYFEIITLALFAMLVGGFVALRFLGG